MCSDGGNLQEHLIASRIPAIPLDGSAGTVEWDMEVVTTDAMVIIAISIADFGITGTGFIVDFGSTDNRFPRIIIDLDLIVGKHPEDLRLM